MVALSPNVSSMLVLFSFCFWIYFSIQTLFGIRGWDFIPFNIDSRILGVLFPGGDGFDSKFGVCF